MGGVGVICKKLSRGLYFVISTSTQIRAGTWYVQFRQKEREMVACLHQGRVIDYRRLSSKIGTLDDDDYGRIESGFRSLYLK